VESLKRIVAASNRHRKNLFRCRNEPFPCGNESFPTWKNRVSLQSIDSLCSCWRSFPCRNGLLPHGNGLLPHGNDFIPPGNGSIPHRNESRTPVDRWKPI